MKKIDFSKRMNNLAKDLQSKGRIRDEIPQVEEVSEILETQQEKVQEFNEARQNEEDVIQKTIELAAQKIVSMITSNSSVYSEDEIAKDLMGLVKSVTTKQIVEKIFEHITCPLIGNPGWKNCGDLCQGKTEYCTGGNFTKCPGWYRYIIFRIMSKVEAKEKSSKKEN